MTQKKFPLWAGWLAVFSIFALNTFWLAPTVMRTQGPFAGNVTFILVRMGALAAFCYWLAALHQSKRWAVIRAASFAMFIEQVPFKALSIQLQGLASLQVAGEAAPTWDGILMYLGFSYILFVPVVILVAFVMSEIAVQRRKPKKSAA
ncbi:MAG: hypothetical protein JNL01_08140 [Bdellovibrionales bacterium]|nr:hypothetical protein [Bdellovibrionales bacterium]